MMMMMMMKLLEYLNIVVLGILLQSTCSETYEPPRILIAPLSKKVAENGVVSFVCRSTGSPRPEIVWRRAGRRISLDHVDVIALPDGSGSVLRIESTKANRDDGLFECVASNGVGEAAVATAVLEVYTEAQIPPGYPRIVEGPTLKAVEKDKDIGLGCNASGYPEPTISWLKDGLPVNVSDPRLRILPTGTLQITKSTETDEGKYECIAENRNGVAYSYGANLYVRVRRVPPHIFLHPEDVEVMPGSDVNLTCAASGSPRPYVKWRHGSVELTNENDAPLGRSVLTLTGVKASARYTCVASSELGNVESEVKVTVKALPNPPTDLTASEVTGHSVRLSWKAPTGEPVDSYNIHFRRKNSLLGQTMDEIQSVEGTHCVVRNLAASTVYEFFVAAANNIGRSVLSTALEVPTGESVPSGSPQNFTAMGISSVAVRLQWDPPSPTNQNGEIVVYELMHHKRSSVTSPTMTNVTETSLIVRELEPTTDFIFQIRAYTRIGPGPWSNRLPFRTFPNMMAPTPTNVRLEWMSSTLLRVTWDAPPLSDVVGYKVYYSPIALTDMDRWSSLDSGPSTASTLIADLESHTAYVVRVKARLSDGKYTNLSEIVSTNSANYDHEDMVSEFRVKSLSSANVMLTWKPPLRTRGLQHYKIVYIGKKKFLDEQNIEQTLIDQEKERLVAKEEEGTFIELLAPKTLYTFNISALFSHGWGPVNSLRVETALDVPPIISAPVLARVSSDTSLLLKLFSAPESFAFNRYCVVTVNEHVARQKHPDDFNLENMDAADAADADAWIAACFNDQLPTEFKLGDASYPRNGPYGNRPLTPGQFYRVFVRGYTADNMSSSSLYSVLLSTTEPRPSGPFLDPASWRLLWILIPICISIVFVLLIILFILFFSRDSRQKRKILQTNKISMVQDETSPDSGDPVEIRRQNFQTQGMISHLPVAVAEFEDHVTMLRANDGAEYLQEFESIEPGQQFSWKASNCEPNLAKNRYANVIAYDHSRVLLLQQQQQTMDGATTDGGDYINANYSDGYRKHNAYIATQGPMASTIGDFWRMVWEQRCSTIVMMTRVEERSRIKCEQYWPNRGTETYDVMQVTIVDVVDLAFYTLRSFQISRAFSQERREVHQLQFTVWPDQGVPDHPLPFLLFVRRVKAVTPLDSGPVIVHCSAGVGRTGVFIVVDSMLERIRHEQTVDIYGHVTCLRAQRNYMVQTLDQYAFIHEAVLEAIKFASAEIPIRSLGLYIQRLSAVAGGETDSGMHREFRKLTGVHANPSEFVTALLPVNKPKNRLANILPYEYNRVCLHPLRGVEGSDYINASFIDGYHNRGAYITTQGPLPETTEDFWRMVWEQNSTIVVMLTKLRELGREKCHLYWPSERSARYQYLLVDPVAEYNMPQYVLREFKVTDARDGQSRTLRQFQFTDWPEQGVPSSGDGFVDFIGQVHKTKAQFGQDGPITVHCGGGGGVGRTGVFVALSIILEHVRYEGAVDIFQTVKLLFLQRHNIIQTQDQYSFCYLAVLEYLSSFEHS